MKVRRIETRDRAEWLRMRALLWPRDRDVHEREAAALLAESGSRVAVFVAECDAGLCGFLEAGTRPYAEGCGSSPVAYVEGWWVDPELRGTGVGRALVAAAEAWGRALGLSEIASDSELDNEAGQAAHRALGFREVGRLVCFRKPL